MSQNKLKAAFCRGGTSNAVFFNGADLPANKELRDQIFLHIMGSPDAYGRQLDGMGGGISSLSKVVIVESSLREDADVDYTFVQVAVDKPVADYGAMCGNMSSAVGPFAVDEKIVDVMDGEVKVRVHNTNTGKIYHAGFEVRDGQAVEQGEFQIPGVSQLGAKIQLDFLNPGGAATGKLLPSGNTIDSLSVDGVGEIEASLVDASNPVAFIRSHDVGISGTEAPTDLDADASLMEKLEKIRRTAAVAMGMAEKPEHALLSNPKIALVAEPREFTALDGREYKTGDAHMSVRLVSMGNFHRAITLTGAMCVAVAAGLKGTLVNQIADAEGEILVGNPSGVLPVQAVIQTGEDGYHATSATTFRTQRRIMEGYVLYPSQLETA